MKNIPIKYKAHKGSTNHHYFWIVTTILFFLMSVFLAFVALHNAKPLHCDDIVSMKNTYTGQMDKVCEINLK